MSCISEHADPIILVAAFLSHARVEQQSWAWCKDSELMFANNRTKSGESQMKTKPPSSAHLEKSPLSEHFHFQGCSWLPEGLEKHCASGRNSPWKESWGQAHKKHRCREECMGGKETRPRTPSGYLGFTILLSCELKKCIPVCLSCYTLWEASTSVLAGTAVRSEPLAATKA